MFERFFDFFLAEPRRLISLGAALARLGGALLVAGLIGQVATTAVSAVKSLAGGGPRPEVLLADVLPGYLSAWMPESIPSFGFALLLIAGGLWAVRTGRIYERYLGH